ncbi:MAG TPA: M20/M25/M40 family metallo-hydrolase [Pyrinomonadaceae bacterium]|nr:M20/M25/M40 family metallo-hydrolase [Pyrinomonadaceae bacterium]
MITKVRPLQSCLLVFALIASAFAQQPSTAPSVDRLRKDVTYLASDALDGRRTGTQGATDAAQYITSEFSSLGLRPGMPMTRVAHSRRAVLTRYLQPFPYVSKVELGKGNLLALNGHPVDGIATRLGEDWLPLGFSSNADIKTAEVVFAGYGISSAGLKYDDYAVSNVKARVAVVFAGTPDGDNPHGQFLQPGQIRFKAAAARAAGARALLIIANEENLKDDRLARLSYDNAGEAGIPITVISRALAKQIINAELPELQKAADARTAAESPLRQPLKGLSLNLTVNVNRVEAPSHNVIGILPGSDPKLKDEAIVIGAHYDHLGRGGQGSLAQSEGEIHHGADDNASGTSGLLELARVLSTQKPKPRRTIVFIAFSGEEEGLIGSNYYVNHPVVPLQNTVAMINLDMVGRLSNQRLVIGGVGTAAEWRSMIDMHNLVQSATVSLNAPPISPGKVASNQPFIVGANGRPVITLDPSKRFSLTLNEDGFGPSDHSSFYAKQIPVLFFWTGTHTDYHKPSDTAEKINYDGLALITSFVANIVRDIDKSDQRPTYKAAQVQSTARSTGFRVYLGTIPNYADSSDGMLLDGVRDGSPAAKAGLNAGDKIVKMAGRDVKNVYDYTQALSEMKGGEEYEVEIVRAGQRMTLKLTPEKR